MELFKKIPLEHEGRAYEIRVLYDDRDINVVAFQDNRPLNGYRYKVLLPKDCAARTILEQHPVDELVEACRRDVEQDRWEALSKVIRESQGQ